MNEQQLSKRLETVASFVDKGAVVADIGSDHAYLPVYLIRQGTAERAIAGEVNKGPLNAAEKQVEKHGLQSVIKTKLGSGLSVLKGETADTVTIAGMGGPLITQILEEGKNELNGVKKMILQPNVAADFIRRWLFQNDWQLTDEAILEEDGHIYEVLVAVRGNPIASYTSNKEKEIWLGPILLKNKNSVFKEKWMRELKQLKKIYHQLEGAVETSDTVNKRKILKQKIGWLKEEFS